jgi:hypothetical protein
VCTAELLYCGEEGRGSSSSSCWGTRAVCASHWRSWHLRHPCPAKVWKLLVRGVLGARDGTWIAFLVLAHSPGVIWLFLLVG